MARYNQQNLIMENGAGIILPPWFRGETGWGNVAIPDIYASDAIAKYPAGTKFVDGDRTWFYTKFKGTTPATTPTTVTEETGYRLIGKGLMCHAFAEDYAAGTVRGVLAEPTIYLGPTSVVTYMGTQAADDFYSGGWINVNDDHFQMARIIQHEYDATTITVGGTSLATPSTLTIDRNLGWALSASATARVMPNKWKHAVWQWESAYQCFGVILGGCMISEPAHSTWMWLQTYGPFSTRAISSGAGGASAKEIEYYWMSDGSLDSIRDGVTDTYEVRANQFAGYSMPHTKSETGTAQDESYPMIFLKMER